MTKRMICIECPKGCSLTVDIDDDKALKVTGAKCPKGILYASSEIENPTRIFTSTVLGEGLTLKLIPVRTDRAIPKKFMQRAAQEAMSIKINKPIRSGDTIVNNFIAPGVKLIATRNAAQGELSCPRGCLK